MATSLPRINLVSRASIAARASEFSPRRPTLDEQLMVLVCVIGFEPMASAFQVRHSNLTELYTVEFLESGDGCEPPPAPSTDTVLLLYEPDIMTA